MIKKILKYGLLLLLVLVLISYLIPAKAFDFFEQYQKENTVSNSLKELLSKGTKQIEVDGITWHYYTAGQGEKTIIFIHGMGGSYDLWWQQLKAFENDYRVISYTLPEDIKKVKQASNGILQILEAENVDKFYAVGTSMGGYIAQYLVNTIPTRVEKVVFGNTFPPNDVISTKNKKKSTIIPLLPERLIVNLRDKEFKKSILPAAKNSKLLEAYLPSIFFSKKQFMNRYAVVIDKFTPNPKRYEVQRIPKLILESDNDPLVEEVLRKEMKDLYPNAQSFTFQKEGHFPYINAAELYNKLIRNFFAKTNAYTEVENTIQNYFEGRKNANIEQLKVAFSPYAKLYTVKENNEFVIKLGDYFKKVKTDGKKQVETKIISGEITNNIANFKTEFKYKDKTYQDYLSLLKTNDGWKIIAKTFSKTK